MNTNFTTSKISRLVLLLIAFAFAFASNAQTDKRLLLAEKYFAAGDYYTAADLYGQFLKPDKRAKSRSDFPLNANRDALGMSGKFGSKTDIVFRQAESYRLANYWEEAAALYKECFEKDTTKYASAFYWYGVCQRGLTNYVNAEDHIKFFLDHAKENPLVKDAEKEKQTLGFIKKQLMRPDTILYKVEKINTSFAGQKGFFAPMLYSGQLLLTSTQTDSAAAGVNPYHNRLFTSSFANGELQHTQPLMIEGLDSTMNQGSASMSADGNHLYFTQWKKENSETLSSIYVSSKTNNGWSKPRPLTINQPGSSSKQPFCSADGKYLYFSSNRKGGSGAFDIWYAPIKEDGTTGAPVNAGAAINTPGNEQSPFFHVATNTLVYASDRLPGMGGFDLFTANKTENGWKAPENMGYPVNSSKDDVYFFSAGEKNLLDNAFISSDRGSDCCLSTYTVTKAPKKKVITGFVSACEDHTPLPDVEVTMKDAEGNLLQTKTDADGRYRFAVTNDGQTAFSLKKDSYVEKSESGNVERIDGSAWHTDTLHNAELCMEKKKKTLNIENVVTVYFDFDKSSLTERATAQLDSIYNILMEDTTTRLQVSGYTDGLGSVAYNAKLSDKRARSCAAYLVEKGIDPSRISFEAFGACCPVEMELINGRDNPDGRSMNRRALINIDRKE